MLSRDKMPAADVGFWEYLGGRSRGGDVAGCYRGLSVAGHPVHSGVAYALKLDVVLCYGVVVFCVLCVVCVCVRVCLCFIHWGCMRGGCPATSALFARPTLPTLTPASAHRRRTSTEINELCRTLPPRPLFCFFPLGTPKIQHRQLAFYRGKALSRFLEK